MKKRLQVWITEEAWNALESVTKEANRDFEAGVVTYSDAVSEMLTSARVDIRSLQIRHTDIRRSLKLLAAQENVDLDAVIKSLTELRGKTKSKKTALTHEEVLQ